MLLWQCVSDDSRFPMIDVSPEHVGLRRPILMFGQLYQATIAAMFPRPYLLRVLRNSFRLLLL